MRIVLTSVFVKDQDKALKFYTETLGFVKKHDVPVGEFKWLTVVSPEDQDGPELLLEPNDNPVAREYQKGIFEQGIPAASFGVEDIRADYERLKALEVSFINPHLGGCAAKKQIPISLKIGWFQLASGVVAAFTLPTVL